MKFLRISIIFLGLKCKEIWNISTAIIQGIFYSIFLIITRAPKAMFYTFTKFLWETFRDLETVYKWMLGAAFIEALAALFAIYYYTCIIQAEPLGMTGIECLVIFPLVWIIYTIFAMIFNMGVLAGLCVFVDWIKDNVTKAKKIYAEKYEN